THVFYYWVSVVALSLLPLGPRHGDVAVRCALSPRRRPNSRAGMLTAESAFEFVVGSMIFASPIVKEHLCMLVRRDTISRQAFDIANGLFDFREPREQFTLRSPAALPFGHVL